LNYDFFPGKNEEELYVYANGLLEARSNQEAAFVFACLRNYRDSFEKRIMYYNPITESFARDIRIKKDGSIVLSDKFSALNPIVESWRDIAAVASGSDHVVGLKRDGTVVSATRLRPKVNFAFTDNPEKLNCVDDLSGYSSVAYNSSWNNIVSIKAYGHTTFGLRGDGTVVRAGMRIGEDGEPLKAYEESAGQISEWRDIAAIEIINNFTVAGLRKDRTVAATSTWDNLHKKVAEWQNIVAIAGKESFLLGLTSDGDVLSSDFYNSYTTMYLCNWHDVVAISMYGSNKIFGLKKNGRVFFSKDDELKESEEDFKDIIALNGAMALKSDGTVIPLLEL
jgi:hypothetical protein